MLGGGPWLYWWASGMAMHRLLSALVAFNVNISEEKRMTLSPTPIIPARPRPCFFPPPRKKQAGLVGKAESAVLNRHFSLVKVHPYLDPMIADSSLADGIRAFWSASPHEDM